MMSKTKQALEHYKQIMDGVVPWYEFKGRLGCWYNFNDGLDEISAIEKYFAVIEDFERAGNMKKQYDILKEYMIEEDIFDKGVLPEYQ